MQCWLAGEEVCVRVLFENSGCHNDRSHRGKHMTAVGAEFLNGKFKVRHRILSVK